MFAHAFKKIREVQSDERGNSLIDLIEDTLDTCRYVKPFEADTWLSVSKVNSMCIRHIVLCSRMNLDMMDEWGPDGRWRADRGTGLHRMFQDSWMAPMGFYLGGWKCGHCGYTHGADENGKVWAHTAIACPSRCSSCGREWRRMDPFHYEEPRSENKKLRVRGRMDGILAFPGKGREVLDLKTTNFLDPEKLNSPWSVTRKPRSYDVAQLHWYMDAAGVRKGRLVYMDPAAKTFEEAMVEHRVPFNPGIMHKEKEKVRGLREALEKKAGPVPDCSHGGILFGDDCPCVDLEDEWGRHGDRSCA